MAERIPFMRTLPVALVALGLLGLACKPATDLNRPCALIRKDPNNPKQSLPITLGELKANKDFISLGVVECEDLVCVRDADFKQGLNDAGITSLSDPAYGYCSRPCLPTNASACPSYDSALDERAATKLSCRALLLDAETLAAICAADPKKCEELLGGTKDPNFCAQGGATGDAGVP
jgi:hypothetical protein